MQELQVVHSIQASELGNGVCCRHMYSIYLVLLPIAGHGSNIGAVDMNCASQDPELKATDKRNGRMFAQLDSQLLGSIRYNVLGFISPSA
jgi:hypothetical protein